MSRVSGQHYPSYGLLKQGPHKVRLPTGRRAFPGRKGSYLIARARRMNLQVANQLNAFRHVPYRPRPKNESLRDAPPRASAIHLGKGQSSYLIAMLTKSKVEETLEWLAGAVYAVLHGPAKATDIHPLSPVMRICLAPVRAGKAFGTPDTVSAE